MARTLWEYALAAMTGNLTEACNTTGADGWEVVQLLPQPDGALHALLKRPKLLIEPAKPEEVRRLVLHSGD